MDISFSFVPDGIFFKTHFPICKIFSIMFAI